MQTRRRRWLHEHDFFIRICADCTLHKRRGIRQGQHLWGEDSKKRHEEHRKDCWTDSDPQPANSCSHQTPLSLLSTTTWMEWTQRMSESQWGVAGDPGPDTTKLSSGLHHRDISEMLSLPKGPYHSMSKKKPKKLWGLGSRLFWLKHGLSLFLPNPLPQWITGHWNETNARKRNDNNDEGLM